VKKTLCQKHPRSKAIPEALHKAPKLKKTIACECGNVSYKTLAQLMKRSFGIIDLLAKSVASMEDKFTQSKETVEWVSQNFEHEIEKCNATIMDLTQHLNKTRNN